MNKSELAEILEGRFPKSEKDETEGEAIASSILSLANLVAERRHTYADFIPVGNSVPIAVSVAEAQLQDRLQKKLEAEGTKTNAEQRAAMLVLVRQNDPEYQAILHESRRIVLELDQMENQIRWAKMMFQVVMENMATERTLATLLDV